MAVNINSQNFCSDLITAVAPLGQNFKDLCGKWDGLLCRTLLYTVGSER